MAMSKISGSKISGDSDVQILHEELSELGPDRKAVRPFLFFNFEVQPRTLILIKNSRFDLV